MSSWRDLAAEVRASKGSAPSKPLTPGLPTEITEGLRALGRMPPPHLTLPKNWPIIVADAQRLAEEGWALKALSLGWSPLDLFGVGERDSYDFAGLSIWLDGRSVAAMDASRAIVIDGGWRRFFRRPTLAVTQPKAVLLWHFGRRQ